MAEPNNTPRPASPDDPTSPESTEMTSLLDNNFDHDADDVLPSSRQDAEASERQAYCIDFPRSVKILTWISLLGAVMDLVLLLGLYITSEYAPYSSYRYWALEGGVLGLGFTIFLAGVLSYINLRKLNTSSGTRVALPLAINLILDVVLVLFIYNEMCRLLEDLQYQGCLPSDLDVEECERWHLALRTLIAVSLAGAVAVGVSHLILFILRCTAAFRSKFWEKAPTWTLPSGQFTVEFTVKFIRQETENGC